MAATYVGVIDQGTTSTRFALFDRDGRIAAFDQREHAQLHPCPGWVEHDAGEIWQRTREVIAGALATAGVAPRQLVALGIANQRETAVIWDRTSGEPVHNAIVWQDTRTAALVHELAGEAGPGRLRARVGLPLSTYFSGPKITWMLDNVASLRARAEAGELLFGTIDSWLLWNLTGGPQGGLHATDATNASRTLLMDLETLDWHQPSLELMGIPRALLPEIRSSSEVYAEATASAAAGRPLAGILGDQQAALFGQACFAPGQAKTTYGTGAFLLVNTGERIVRCDELLTSVAHRLGDEPAAYALEGAVAVAGGLVQWLRDGLQMIATAAEIEPLAASVDDSGGVYVVPAFSGLFAPHWRDDARGVIVGLTAHATRAHLARAALEAAAWQTRDVVDAVNAVSGQPLAQLRVDGGMTGNALLMQLQADVLGIPVLRPVVSETTALGAAFAAELSELGREERRWLPRMDGAERERRHARWQMAVARSLDWER